VQYVYIAVKELVGAVMFMYHEAKAKFKYSNYQFIDFIGLSIGVLRGDTLGSYIFVSAVDYILRVALADQPLGLKITDKIGRYSRIKSHAEYTTDLDFANDRLCYLFSKAA
jgi:hypothetical protein